MAEHATDNTTLAPPSFAEQRNLAFIFGLVGTVLCLIGWISGEHSRDAFYRSWLYAWFFFFGLTIGCQAWVMIHHLVGGGWGRAIQRIAEAGMLNVPLMAVLFIPIIVGLKSQYPWADHEWVSRDSVLVHRVAYMNASFWIIRTIIYFVIWGLLSLSLVSLQRRYDLDPNPGLVLRLRRLSAPGLIIYVFVMTMAGVDWIMSREPHWYSNVYGFILVVGQALTSINFLVICLTILLRVEPLKSFVTRGHYNDLGNLMFTTIILWAYMNLAQFLITWMGSMQEDVAYYYSRRHLFYPIMAIVLHFFLPFFILLSKDLKRRPDRLVWVAGFIFVIHMIDVYFMVWPSNLPRTPWSEGHKFAALSVNRYWLNVAAPIGIGGLWLAMFLRQLGRRPLLAAATSGEPSESLESMSDPEVGPHGERHAHPA